MSDDAQLLRRYAEESSEAAFKELVERHLDLVYSAALRQVGGDAYHAQDVTQTVFTVLAHKAAAVARHPVLVGWLYTSTQHAAAKVRRAEARRHTREHEAHLMQQLTSPAAPAVDWEQLRPVLDDAMHELTDRDREAVLLRYFARRPFADIGTALNLSEDAARMRVDRALAKLHALLARRGVTSTAAALSVVLANQAVAAAPAGLTATVCNIAFAHGTTAGGAVAGWLTFMSTTKFASIAAVALAVLAVGTATREVFASRATDDSLAVARQDAATMSARLHDLEQRVSASDQDRGELQRTADEARAAQAAAASRVAKPTADAPSAADNVATNEQIAAGTVFLARHPDLKQALVDRSRARVDSRFRPLYRQLNLTPAQIEQFENLLIEGEGVNMSNPLSGGPMVLRPGTGLSADEVESRVRELLGDEGYRQYKDASTMVRGRQFALQVAGALYFTDTPLTAPQSEQLARITEAARIESRDAKTGRDGYWASVMGRAQGVLSDPQLAVLAGFQQQEQFDAELNRLRGGWMMPGWTGADSKAKSPPK